MKKFLSWMMNAALTSAFGLWASNIMRLTRSRNVISHILKRMSNKMLFWTFERWMVHVGELRDEQTDEQRRNNLMRKFLKQFFDRAISRAFIKWRVSFEELRRFGRFTIKLQKKRTASVRAATMVEWVKYVNTLQYKRRRMTHMLKHAAPFCLKFLQLVSTNLQFLQISDFVEIVDIREAHLLIDHPEDCATSK